MRWCIRRIFGEISFGPTRYEPVEDGFQMVTPVYDRDQTGRVVSVTEHLGLVVNFLHNA